LRKLFKGEEEIELTSVEFQLMEYLMANPEKKLARKEILERVWGKDYYGDEKVVDVNVRRLRMKIEDDPSSPKHLTTVWGSGYKWIP
jgi:DNA-binding response OmpR family regulator